MAGNVQTSAQKPAQRYNAYERSDSFWGVTTTRRKQIERGEKERERESVAAPSVEKGDRKRGEREEDRGYDRGAGGGGCSFKPIAMVRPGVWQTLHSVSNNVNKRASILRFYRPALSIFDNALARARLCLAGVRGGGGGWRARQDQKRICTRRGPLERIADA